MKKIRDFQCKDGETTFERMVIDSVKVVKCECKGEANRLLSSPRVVGNTTGRSPSFSNRG